MIIPYYPKTGAETMKPKKNKVITLKIEEDLLRELDKAAALKHITRSELIRRAIRWYLKEYGETPEPKIVKLES